MEYELLMTVMRFAILCLIVACLTAFRSRANYEAWRRNGRTSALVVARNQYSLAESSLWMGRLALLVAIVFFVLSQSL